MPSGAAAYEARAKVHFASAARSEAAGEEWCVVSYFYACFHAVRAALSNDTRLSSDKAARAENPKLTASSRHVDFHEGHPSRGPGLNQVVKMLYPEIGVTYAVLHLRSVEVRYGDGISAGSLSNVAQQSAEVFAALRARGLIS